MILYLILLVGSVFLGTHLLAISTPVAQLSLYRILSLGVVPILFVQIMMRHPHIKWHPRNAASFSIGVLLIWWIWAVSSVVWAVDIVAWFQAVFLLTLGISSILGLYFWVNRVIEWEKLLITMWAMMSCLVVWGYVEIVTGIYVFANLDKLDKYKTFGSSVSSRIPITFFANQNDYATMLIAYLAICFIVMKLLNRPFIKLSSVALCVGGLYLIYRSGSRMSLLCALILCALQLMQSIHLDFSKKHYQRFIVVGIGLSVLAFLVRPQLWHHVTHVFTAAPFTNLSGDEVRINLWRNGVIFLGKTVGFGVGAGNIEYWMSQYAVYPIETIVNMHNWWLEILVAYGGVVFIGYVMSYISLIVALIQHIKTCSVHQCDRLYRHISIVFVTYLIVSIFSMITSANNMFIEWHWLMFGLIVSYVKIISTISKFNSRKEGKHELNNII